MRVLAIDGGGVRGVVPARVLAELEREARRPINELFDLVAGASTGGLIGLAVTAPQNREDMHLARLLAETYDGQARAVFKKPRLQRVPNVPLNLRVYDREPIRALAHRFVGESRLDEATVPLMVPAYDLSDARSYWFKSWVPERAAFSMQEVALAASAAPTYFRTFHVPWDEERKEEHTFIDGGVFANNPSLVAWMEAQRLHPGRPVLIVSLGTGDVTGSDGRPPEEWGLREWVTRGLQTIFDANSDHVDQLLTQHLGDTYLRVQISLPSDKGAMDDPEILPLLQSRIDSEIERRKRSGFFSGLVEQLKAPLPG